MVFQTQLPISLVIHLIGIQDLYTSKYKHTITSGMATWECFVDNRLSECFDVVVNYTEPNLADTSSSSSDESYSQNAIELRKLHKGWPNWQSVLQQAIKHRALKNKPLEVVTFETRVGHTSPC